MAKKKTTTAVDWKSPKLKGKTFHFSGRVQISRKEIEKLVTDEGGQVADRPSLEVHFVVVAEPTGTSTVEQKIAKLNAKGASIEVLGEQSFHELFVPTRDELLAMLKAERFRLFAQASGDQLIGVVKSQNDPDLVYSCRLTKEGDFACCTQNLNVCGGLRGALCKHLLVLIIGMTHGGELDPTLVNQWIKASHFKKPELDKDVMSETLLRYKGAEAGEVDWRPMVTIPEDYYAL